MIPDLIEAFRGLAVQAPHVWLVVETVCPAYEVRELERQGHFDSFPIYIWFLRDRTNQVLDRYLYIGRKDIGNRRFLNGHKAAYHALRHSPEFQVFVGFARFYLKDMIECDQSQNYFSNQCEYPFIAAAFKIDPGFLVNSHGRDWKPNGLGLSFSRLTLYKKPNVDIRVDAVVVNNEKTR